MDILCGLCLTCWPLPRANGTACHNSTCPCHIERIAAMAQAAHDRETHIGDVYDAACPTCNPDHYRQDTLYNLTEDARITDKLRDEYPGYRFDGRDGSIEAEDDDEDRIADAAEAWQDYLEFQRTSY